MSLPDATLHERIAKDPWTAYNIRLSDAVTTMPGKPDFLSGDFRLYAVLRTLSLLYHGDLTGLRVADLACLEGGFSLALAQRGANVLGIEARKRNLEKAQLLREHFELPNLEFSRGDVKEFSRDAFGTFDVVLALGILYHLDEPVSWLRQIAEATRGVLIVDTHFAPLRDTDLAQLDPTVGRLGGLERKELAGWTYEGRWFREVPRRGHVDPETDLWAAYSNDRSFWLTKGALQLALRGAGFESVFEQHDWIADHYDGYTAKLVRTMFVGAKPAAFTGGSRSGRPPGDR
ncbi:MAG TPA: methyltransferase domain-containing protein [Methylomirabilota bacterium]|jgi:hypothetical protein|nr:methyltransferase domain-containing protein [Methylomirabilota bacterium]